MSFQLLMILRQVEIYGSGVIWLFEFLKTSFSVYDVCFSVCAFPKCKYVYHTHAWFPHRSEEGCGTHETVVMDGFKHCVGAGN